MPDDRIPDDAGRDEEETRHIDLERIDSLPLDTALSIVGEETRAEIILQLGDARSTDPSASNALGFSELMTRVGAEDSGGFNYHLGKLVGTFVGKTDDGYRLRLPGQLLYRALVAGTITERRTIEPSPIGDCPRCDGQLSWAYHPDHLLTVECVSCETLFDAIHFPTRGLENRSTEAILDAAYGRRHHEVGAMRRGACHGCGGIVERSLQPGASITYGSGSVEEMAGLDVYAVLACEACKTSLVGHPTNVALTAPVVVGFFADHGRDVALSRWWDDPIAAARDAMDIVGKDPQAVEIPFEIDGNRLEILVDADLQVVEVERS